MEGLQPISTRNRKMPASLSPGGKLGGYGVGLSSKVVGLALPYDEVINQAMPRMMQVSGTRLACPGIRLDQLMIFEQLLQKMLVGHRSAFPAVGFGPRTCRRG